MDRILSITLFQRLLGAEFFHLAPAIKELHGRHGDFRHAGVASVRRGRGPLKALLARIAGLPPTMEDAPIEVRFNSTADGEVWRRRFGTAAMQSRLRAGDGLLVERLGPCTFGIRLVRIGKELAWTVERARLFGIMQLPATLFDGVRCRESEDEAGRYRFFVEARLPVIGLLIRYEGWLQPADAVTAG
ncbi:DUF4166 domain-containing protein [Solilutibacter silvestris]|uniref:DUF4166 domain-containing protein n=1 Tax=Solilutibacter silvestris TaxID=1645665 RepID=A0A2K1Q2P8_9GAMM|nr:DUF4166 domain-containing protein [Lysobacter silvestris]PNS09326.1 hypothetical protein Lysil_0955 [Lysobacter silvestris]